VPAEHIGGKSQEKSAKKVSLIKSYSVKVVIETLKALFQDKDENRKLIEEKGRRCVLNISLH